MLNVFHVLCLAFLIEHNLSLLGFTNTPFLRQGRAGHSGLSEQCGPAQLGHFGGVLHGPGWISAAQRPQRA